ncbi:DUF4124 domain-containing protein [Massilia sp. W12]|uniref:DUF4124 domain-containing protein n=1 Tax=Massilia sp. W12 TaxID=3126507 RepID=UPI0030D45A07
MTMQSLQQKRCRAGLSLLWTAVGSMVIAALVVGTLFSMRYERNVFFDAIAKFTGDKKTAEAMDKTKEAMQQAKSAATGKDAPPKMEGRLQKCVIDGKTVYSDTACGKGENAKLPSLQVVDAPKKEEPPPAKPMNATDAAIERATR